MCDAKQSGKGVIGKEAKVVNERSQTNIIVNCISYHFIKAKSNCSVPDLKPHSAATVKLVDFWNDQSKDDNWPHPCQFHAFLDDGADIATIIHYKVAQCTLTVALCSL